jgi:Zn-dependent peptidase ImmA (M78 family)
MTRHATAQIRTRVRSLLEEHRIRKPPVRVRAVAKRLGIEIRHEPFEGEISGVLYRSRDSAIIGVNSLHHRNRQRFTIAHEIGHFLLHEFEVHVDKGYRIVLRDGASSRATDPSEIEANQFAAELLMPLHFLKRDIPKFMHDLEEETGLEELARLYRVSRQAMAFRLVNLGLISSEG